MHTAPNHPHIGGVRVIVLTGNPRPDSRTLTIAHRVAERVAVRLSVGLKTVSVVDLAVAADQVFLTETPFADHYRDLVISAAVVVFPRRSPRPPRAGS